MNKIDTVIDNHFAESMVGIMDKYISNELSDEISRNCFDRGYHFTKLIVDTFCEMMGGDE